MTYQSVWWHDPLEYGAGLQPNRTWPTIMEQYRRPKDMRYYDLPTENYESKLYYEHPHLGKPVYRGLFRDKPHTITSYHPSGIENKPKGFHGRLYYEEENPRFKYNGRAKNDLYYLELPPYRPVYPKQNNACINDNCYVHPINRRASSGSSYTKRDITATSAYENRGGDHTTRLPQTIGVKPPQSWNNSAEQLLRAYHQPPAAGSSHHLSNRLTQDGAGYL